MPAAIGGWVFAPAQGFVSPGSVALRRAGLVSDARLFYQRAAEILSGHPGRFSFCKTSKCWLELCPFPCGLRQAEPLKTRFLGETGFLFMSTN
jgi:hypothetical protein